MSFNDIPDTNISARRASSAWVHGLPATINNPRDFYIGKSLRNLPALCKIGFAANRRVLQVQRISQNAIVAEETLQQLQRPRQVNGQRVSAMPLVDPTAQALWNTVLLFELLPAGFSNRQLREPLAQLLGVEASTLTQGRMSYHLRRLRLHGLIQRIPKTHRYRLTSVVLRMALFCTRFIIASCGKASVPSCLKLLLFQIPYVAALSSSNNTSTYGSSRLKWLPET
jgi:hypothetical protein